MYYQSGSSIFEEIWKCFHWPQNAIDLHSAVAQTALGEFPELAFGITLQILSHNQTRCVRPRSLLRSFHSYQLSDLIKPCVTADWTLSTLTPAHMHFLYTILSRFCWDTVWFNRDAHPAAADSCPHAFSIYNFVFSATTEQNVARVLSLRWVAILVKKGARRPLLVFVKWQSLSNKPGWSSSSVTESNKWRVGAP